jgi:hypothetical protein
MVLLHATGTSSPKPFADTFLTPFQVNWFATDLALANDKARFFLYSPRVSENPNNKTCFSGPSPFFK